MERGVLVVVAAAGCYEPASIEPCTATCSATEPCPAGFACGGDGLCHVAGEQACSCPTDPFAGAALDPNKWDLLSPAPPLPAIERDELVIALPAGEEQTTRGLVSRRGIDFAANAIEVGVLATPTGTGVESAVELILDQDHRYAMTQRGLELACGVHAAQQFAGATQDFNPEKHRRWRIRFADTSVVFETSPDEPLEYSPCATVEPMVPATSLQVRLIALRNGLGSPAPGAIRIDEVVLAACSPSAP